MANSGAMDFGVRGGVDRGTFRGGPNRNSIYSTLCVVIQI